VLTFVLLAAGIPYFLGKTARLDVPDVDIFRVNLYVHIVNTFSKTGLAFAHI
jgi:hypothetical protein